MRNKYACPCYRCGKTVEAAHRLAEVLRLHHDDRPSRHVGGHP